MIGSSHSRTLSLLLALLLMPSALLAEEKSDTEVDDKYVAYLSDDPPEVDESGPVEDTFESVLAINTQTVEQHGSNTLGFVIQHRFGQISSDLEDLFGIYAPANIRLGLSYGITDWLQVGLGAAKNGAYQDLNYKVRVLRQTSDESMPLSLSYYGVGTLQAGPSDNFAKFSHRAALFQQLLIARKFGYYFSLQIAPSFMHFNIVDEAGGFKHDNFGLSIIGKIKTSATTSVILEAGQGQLLYSPDQSGGDSKPILGLGFEMVTTGHAFQLFVSSTNRIINHQAYAYNPYDVAQAELFMGFNITRNWNF